MGGAAWIVRDHGGLPLSHSRRAFSGHTSCIEAELQSLLWSIRALIDLRIKWVVIESSLTQVREALLKPDEIANAIALSVTRDHRYQSYVATGGPTWLSSLLREEELNSVARA
ncbi:hypothetical protein F2Q70_00028030 [Brassica cretica]|nr:hypothetical protein F2Q70_00028030 [Brassica cretica]KAF3579558.1 hypothetical protein DY000_02034655 [Brassica cretica]